MPQAKQAVRQEHSPTHQKNETKKICYRRRSKDQIQDQINQEEIGNLPEKEFRVMIVKMIQNLGSRMEAQIEKIQEMINKDLEELKNKQTARNSTITEMKNTLEGINSRITEAEEQISELEDRMVEITAEEQNKEKRVKRNDDSLRDLWDNIKRTNIRTTGAPEEEQKEKGSEKIFVEIIVKNFPNMKREIPIQVHELQSPRQDKLKEKHAETHINQTNKNKIQRKILKAAREKQQITYKGIPIRLSADFSAETLQARREWQDIYKAMKGKNPQPRLLSQQGSHSDSMEKSKALQKSKS